MTVKIKNLEAALRVALLQAGSNNRIIFFAENGPRPQLPYTTIEFLNIEAETSDWNNFDPSTNLLNYVGYRNATFTLNFYGEDAVSEALQVQASLNKQSIRDTLRNDYNCSIIGLGVITNLTELNVDEFEQRATFDITLNAAFADGSTQEDTGYFDTVEPIDWTNKPTI